MLPEMAAHRSASVRPADEELHSEEAAAESPWPFVIVRLDLYAALTGSFQTGLFRHHSAPAAGSTDQRSVHLA